MLVGSHVSPADPLGAAAEEGADCVQIFLSNPLSWKAPRSRADAEVIRSSGFPVYVHAPYLVNLAAGSSRVRIPSRKILQQTCEGAAEIGARAVVVHGGHVTGGGGVEEGIQRWVDSLTRLHTEVPVLLENTAGGGHALTRRLDTFARLWDRIGDLGVGVCLDTCHAHASGEEMVGLVERLVAVTGGIDLVHCNDSKDPAGSGRDRHEHLGHGLIDPEVIVDIVRSAGAPIICETGEKGRKEDLAWLRTRLASSGSGR